MTILLWTLATRQRFVLFNTTTWAIASPICFSLVAYWRGAVFDPVLWFLAVIGGALAGWLWSLVMWAFFGRMRETAALSAMTSLSASVFLSTGQMWKLHLGTLAHMSTLVLLVWVALTRPQFILIALVPALVGAGFCALSIRCPRCGDHWYWRELKASNYGLKFGWVRRMLSQAECSACGYQGKDSGA